MRSISKPVVQKRGNYNVFTPQHLSNASFCDLTWLLVTEWGRKYVTCAVFFKNLLFLFLHSLLKYLQNDVWFVGIEWKMTELHLFEVDGVSKVNKCCFKVFWRFQSKITQQHCIFSPTSFLNNHYLNNNHNIAIFNFLFVIINKNPYKKIKRTNIRKKQMNGVLLFSFYI